MLLYLPVQDGSSTYASMHKTQQSAKIQTLWFDYNYELSVITAKLGPLNHLVFTLKSTQVWVMEWRGTWWLPFGNTKNKSLLG